MSNAINIQTTKHPDKYLAARYAQLQGIEVQKAALLLQLQLIFHPAALSSWMDKHHGKPLPYFERVSNGTPMILLSGDVGCGKTELASTIGTALSELLGDKTVLSFSAPSDLRGMGLVGQISARITAYFAEAKRQVGERNFGILVLDEADDLATTREQDQAHHEDRAGVNALIKEIDQMAGEKTKLALILISNRPEVLDPAILRRAAAHISFSRPDEATLREIWRPLVTQLSKSEADLDAIVAACCKKTPQFTFSDIFNKILRGAMFSAFQHDRALDIPQLLQAIAAHTASPQFKIAL